MMTQHYPYSATYWIDHDANPVILQAGKHFRFDLDAVDTFCQSSMPRLLVDYLRIATTLYAVDRLVKRNPKTGRQRETRTIGLKIEVLNCKFWNLPEIRENLCEALEFVTGDIWHIEFDQDSQICSDTRRLIPTPSDDRLPIVCLYSGGLDSGAGLAVRMQENPDKVVIPVMVCHQTRQKELARNQFIFLKKKFSNPVYPLFVDIRLNWKAIDKLLGVVDSKRHQELSQRSRSFLFCTLGAITAILHGQKAVEMFESGVGAINLPLTPGLARSKTTKSSHPNFLRLMSTLSSAVANYDLKFTLPFMDRTKGEVVKSLSDPVLQEFAAMTVSCIHYPHRHKLHKQCGLCPACIFRRAALNTAGIAEPQNSYQYDFLGPVLTNQIPEKRLKYLKAFLSQIVHLRGIEKNDRLPPRFEQHVVPNIVAKGDSQNGVIQLLRRYRSEWMVLISTARENGQDWTRLLGSEPPAIQGVNHAAA